MLVIVLSAILAQITFDDTPDASRALASSSASDLRRVHDLMSGKWDIVGMDDNGERIGAELVRRRFARDGRVTISDRLITIINPEDGRPRDIAFRINTSTTPREIEVIDRDDNVLKGIFKFEDDDLIICLARHENGARPDAFVSPVGSDRLLFRLRLPAERAVEPTLTEKPHTLAETAAVTTTPAATTPPATAAPATPASTSRRPTENEVRRAHEALAGLWEVRSMVDNGQNIGPELIRKKFAEDGRVQIGSNFVSFVGPGEGRKRVSVFQVDPAATPSQIDVTSEFDNVLKGIYKFDGDDLVLCLAKHSDVDRPATFDAPAGSDHMMFRLSMVPPEPAPPASPPAPTAAEISAEREATIRNMLVGSWTYTDRKGTVTIVFRPNGTFIATRAYSRALKKLFDGTNTSEGRWTYSHGLLTANISLTQDRRMAGHTYSARIQSIGDSALTFEDALGELRNARKIK